MAACLLDALFLLLHASLLYLYCFLLSLTHRVSDIVQPRGPVIAETSLVCTRPTASTVHACSLSHQVSGSNPGHINHLCMSDLHVFPCVCMAFPLDILTLQKQACLGGLETLNCP